MLAEALSWYVESLTAFWSGLARPGLLRLLLVGLVLWWIFGRKGRGWCGCPRCGCWCGRCRCREVDGRRGEPESTAEAGSEGAEAGGSSGESG